MAKSTFCHWHDFVLWAHHQKLSSSCVTVVYCGTCWMVSVSPSEVGVRGREETAQNVMPSKQGWFSATLCWGGFCLFLRQLSWGNRYSEFSICFLFSVFTQWEAAAVLRATVNRSNCLFIDYLPCAEYVYMFSTCTFKWSIDGPSYGQEK